MIDGKTGGEHLQFLRARLVVSTRGVSLAGRLGKQGSDSVEAPTHKRAIVAFDIGPGFGQVLAGV